MVLSLGAVVTSIPLAIAVGAGSAATATGAGVALAAAGATATTSAGAVAAGVASFCAEAVVTTGATLVTAGPAGWVVLGAGKPFLIENFTLNVLKLGIFLSSTSANALQSRETRRGIENMAAGVKIAKQLSDGLSWDCWRPVLRDFDSKEPRGRLLKDIAVDPRVVEVRSKPQEGYWPQIWLKNKWQEEFRIDYVQLPGGEIAAHASRI